MNDMDDCERRGLPAALGPEEDIVEETNSTPPWVEVPSDLWMGFNCRRCAIKGRNRILRYSVVRGMGAELAEQ